MNLLPDILKSQLYIMYTIDCQTKSYVLQPFILIKNVSNISFVDFSIDKILTHHCHTLPRHHIFSL